MVHEFVNFKHIFCITNMFFFSFEHPHARAMLLTPRNECDIEKLGKI